MTSIGGVVLLHGGVSQYATSDTWQWGSDKWTKVQEIGPRRHGHALTYDNDRNRVVLFGGHLDQGDPGNL